MLGLVRAENFDARISWIVFWGTCSPRRMFKDGLLHCLAAKPTPRLTKDNSSGKTGGTPGAEAIPLALEDKKTKKGASVAMNQSLGVVKRGAD